MKIHNNAEFEQDRLFYNERPYIYLVLSLFSFIFAKDSMIAIASGVILLICGLYVIHIRHTFQIASDELEIRYQVRKK